MDARFSTELQQQRVIMKWYFDSSLFPLSLVLNLQRILSNVPRVVPSYGVSNQLH
jgi:hypothetical protein